MVEVPISIIATIAIAAFFFMLERLVQAQRDISSSIDEMNQELSTELSKIGSDVEDTKSEIRRANEFLAQIDARSDGGADVEPGSTNTSEQSDSGETVDQTNHFDAKGTFQIDNNQFRVLTRQGKTRGARITFTALRTKGTDQTRLNDILKDATGDIAEYIRESGYNVHRTEGESEIIVFDVPNEGVSDLTESVTAELKEYVSQRLEEKDF